jgi:hypothetical protein
MSGQKVLDSAPDVVARNDGVAQRNPVAGVAGHKQARRLGFHVVHHRPDFSVAHVVLRNGFAIDGHVLEGRLAADAQQGGQILDRQLDQGFG